MLIINLRLIEKVKWSRYKNKFDNEEDENITFLMGKSYSNKLL